MKSINLSVRNISKIFWEIIYLNKDLLKNDFRENFFNKLNDLERLRSIANLMLFRQSKEFNNHYQINPPSEEFLKLHNFHSNCLLGLLVPLHEFRLTNQ